MQHFKHETPLGPVDYQLYRRTTGGNWCYAFSWKGKQARHISTGTRDLIEAKVKTVKAIEETQNGTAGEKPTAQAALTLAELFDTYTFQRWPMPAERVNNDTLKSLNSMARAWFNRLIRLPKKNVLQPLASCEDADTVYTDAEAFPRYGGQLAGVTADADEYTVTAAFNDFVNQYKRFVTGTTVHGHQRAFHRFCAWLMKAPRKVLWRSNPASKALLEMPVENHVVKPPSNERDIEAAVNQLKADILYPAVVLMCSAFRPKEVCRAVWGDFKLDGATGTALVRGKGQQQRIIQLSAWSTERLKEYRKASGVPDGDAGNAEKVWPGQHNSLFQRLRRKKYAGTVAPITLGGCRRFVAFTLWQSGLSIQEACDIMGNSPKVLTDYYVQFGTMKNDKAAAALNFSFGKPQKQASKKRSKRSAEIIPMPETKLANEG